MNIDALMQLIRHPADESVFTADHYSRHHACAARRTRRGLAGDVLESLVPPTVVVNNAVVQQNTNVILGVRINLESAPMLPWGLMGNNIASFTGPVERLYITLLAGPAADMTFLAARGIGVGYSGGLTAAGTPSASPAVVGGGATGS